MSANRCNLRRQPLDASRVRGHSCYILPGSARNFSSSLDSFPVCYPIYARRIENPCPTVCLSVCLSHPLCPSMFPSLSLTDSLPPSLPASLSLFLSLSLSLSPPPLTVFVSLLSIYFCLLSALYVGLPPLPPACLPLSVTVVLFVSLPLSLSAKGHNVLLSIA